MFIHSVANLSIIRVVSANRLLNSPVGITIHRKNRKRWAVALKLGGKTIYDVKGESVVSDRLHPVILPRGCSYSFKCVEAGECIIIEFDADGTEARIGSFELKDNSLLLHNFAKIEKSLSQKSACSRMECAFYLYEILLFLLKNDLREQPHPKKQLLLRPAIKYIAEHYSDGGITNETLSGLCGMSQVYFRRVFASVYGTSPIRYLHDFRMEKAKAMLKSDYETVEQVALSVGYNSIYHFSKMFKTYTGKSPTEYIKTKTR